VSDDWAAVARAINQRVSELGLRQYELAERSQVSQAMVREIQQNKVQRRRGTRTLEALSIALEWHPYHLTAVLEGRNPPAPGDPVASGDEEVRLRLALIERRLRDITRRLDTLPATLAEVIGSDRDPQGQ
jgi:transcriptional regulator with XRE-family HTH domain